MLTRKYGGQHEIFDYLSQKYHSQIVGLRLGRELTVAIRGYALVKEALSNDAILGRPDNFFYRLRTLGQKKGISFADGEHWEEHRPFILKSLRQIGYGKAQMETIAVQELDAVIRIINEEKPCIQPHQLLTLSSFNVLWTLITGQRIERSEDRPRKLLQTLRERSGHFDLAGGILNQLPWLRFLLPDWSGYSFMVNFNQQMVSYFSEIIQQHVETYTDDKASDDLIYAYIKEIKNQKHSPDTSYTEMQITSTLLDFFIAGGLNVGAVLDLLLMMMVVRPDIQAKVHEAIDQLQDQIQWSDRDKLSFVQAVILEVQRFFPTIAFGGPRRALQDCTIGGYHIPKGTTLFSDLKSVHHEQEYWKDPEVFRPERFLDGHGKLVNTERVIPFSLGKRRCFGDILSKTTVFLFFSGILQQFEIVLPDGDRTPSTEMTPGMMYMPKPFKVSFKRRR
ncbi:probable cytochrome P450 305a1 [Culex quinquefasciatus]|uniref:probable cytochrome P450 305a1 n=1 Tax=Culex quinquefasciatus TaxID=7176 RepID=UPI0018E3C325|nr:probable cytochrome P450 305a1 [Culex quinquefasciatus]